MKTKYQHIYFEKTKLKKEPYIMRGNKSHFVMGTIYYHKPWKKYAIEFGINYVFDENCLRDVADFLDQLNG